MRKAKQLIDRIAINGILYIGILFMLILTVASGVLTSSAEAIGNQAVIIRWDTWYIQLPLAVICFLILCMTGKFVSKIKYGERILLLTVMAWAFVCCTGLILWGRSAPTGDAFSVYDIAANFAWGYYDAMKSPDSYLTFYPQQIGLISFYESIFRVCNALSVPVAVYHYIKVVNSIMVCFTIFFQWKMVKALFGNGNQGILYLLLIPFCFPLYLYSSFLYGEIPSLFMMTLAMWMEVRLCRKFSWSSGIILVLSAGAAVALRKNSLIFVIAACIVLMLSWLKKKKGSILFSLIAVSIISVSILPCIGKWYGSKVDMPMSKGVSALSYFAMGMQESPNGAGAYNGFNFETYLEAGGNQEKIKEISLTAIRERQQYFMANPEKAIDFYCKKFLGQWTNGDYGSRQSTAVDYGGRAAFLETIYTGNGYQSFTGIVSFYQFVIYLGAMCFFACQWRDRKSKKQDIVIYLGMIAVFGGFLFHMIWEADSRYIFPYYLFLIPYAAMGIAEVSKILKLKGGKSRHA